MKNKKLFNVLINSYALYLKTQSYHWNFVGQGFYEKHLLFQSQYEDLALAIDAIAERIRMLNEFVVISFEVLGKESKLSKITNKSDDMMKDLCDSNKKLCGFIKDAMKGADEVTQALLQERLAIHEKNCWFLESSIVKK